MKHLVQVLDRPLAAQGFRRARSTWNRITGDYVDVLDLQQSKDRGDVTMNLGVFYRPAYVACWGNEEIPKFIVEPDATVRIRIGHLLGGRDEWWPVNGVETEHAPLTALDEHALPFFASMHPLEGIERMLSEQARFNAGYPPPSIYLAAIRHSLGNVSGACDLLAELRQKSSPAWLPKVLHAEKLLGCA